MDDADLVSLRDNEMADIETEQLINEIEQLTSRALEETQQWKSLSGSPGNKKDSDPEHNLNSTTDNHHSASKDPTTVGIENNNGIRDNIVA